ncbi:thioredoxin domain-containing protein [Natronococcus occultus]|uniref:Protein-disulfide isomerase n=1 Tax=Natronococcus occultus SP4 TaxID=694430 RepID=L0K2F8_9EURY|nr:thioredoxin domain-containing protein [Natronococcus occultus]AGB38544.1 protein-disulfide isomerase [Natronococcus occultus SP4]
MTQDNRTRRRVLQIGSGAAVAGLAGCTDFLSDDEDDEDDGSPNGNESDGGNGGNGDDPDEDDEIEEPKGALDPIPTPDDPKSVFPIAGEGDAPVTIKLFGSWKSAETSEFMLEEFTELLEEYVKKGAVDLEVHAIASFDGTLLHGDDGPRLARAGLAVWDHDPDQFWAFVECVAINIDTEKEWATPDRLKRVAKKSDVDDPETVYDAAAGDTYQAELDETVDQIEELSVDDVPQVSVEGTVYSPTKETDELYAAIEAAVDEKA